MLQRHGDSAASREGTIPWERIALVLAGGKSLGAFEAGAYQALHEAGIQPDWVIGASIGAINGTIIAGNPAERRIDALRRFWSKAALPSPLWAGLWGEAVRQLAAETEAAILGSPAVFKPNPFWPVGYAWPAPLETIGLYDLAPLRRSLEEFVDFDRVNRGDMRLTLVAVDLETGEEVLFDNRRTRILPEHVLASGAMLAEFPPIEIDGRLFVDGGLRSNLPVDVVAREADEDMLCIAIDLFSARGHKFRNIPEATARRQELWLVSSGLQFLEAHRHEEALRDLLRAVLDLVPEDLLDRPEVQAARGETERPEITLVRLVWPSGDEVGLNTYDWSDRTLTMRWRAGAHAAAQALRAPALSGALVAKQP